MRFILRLTLIGILLLTPLSIHAQELHQDIQGVWRAKVLEVSNERTVTVPGTRVVNTTQTLSVKLLDGVRSGEIVTFENDYIQLDAGDTFYLNYMVTVNGEEFYSVREVDRRVPLAGIFLLFVLAILILAGKQGLRSLLSLAGSLLVIMYVLVPGLVQGYSPIPISIAVASAILFFAIFFTHGFNRLSVVAFSGTILAVALTGLLAYFSIHITNLTGFASDESIYLNLNTGGTLDFVGLLLAGIIIGALGVLDDIAITQVAVVRELYETSVRVTRWSVYRKAMRIGREHVSALVNTLVLAYTGAALPLLLLFSLSESSTTSIINTEVFATEIVRSLIGSIGVVCTVPIVTFLAVMFLRNYSGEKCTQQEEEKIHAHSHSL